MRVHALILVASLFAACATNPPSNAGSVDNNGGAISSEEICSFAQCDYNVRVVLKEENGEVFDKTFDALPIVRQHVVFVYGGMTVYIEANVKDGKLVDLKLVDAVESPRNTITATLLQDEKGAMTLLTRNPFDQPLRIRMGIMPLSHGQLVKTSSCPVVPHGSAFEMWPYPIFQIVFADMRLLQEGESMACME